MVRWVVGSMDSLIYFSLQPSLHDWSNTGHDMCNPVCGMVHIKEPLLLIRKTGADGAVVMSSANGLVGTGFASRYRLQPRVGLKDPMGRCMATTPSSLSLTSNRITTNY